MVLDLRLTKGLVVGMTTFSFLLR